MASITENKNRIGRFTSSEIVRLVDKPSVMAEYVQEKIWERKAGRSINTEVSARPLNWGKLVEKRAFEVLGIEYQLCSNITLEHHEYGDIWSGSPDARKYDEVNGDTVIDLKCPITLKSFFQFASCNSITEAREKHKECEKYYWQLVSNACITGAKYAELIVYCPYRSELPIIRDMAANMEEKPWLYRPFYEADDNELPWVEDNGNFKNLYVFRFEVPEADKKLLTEKVKAAGLMLPKTLS